MNVLGVDNVILAVGILDAAIAFYEGRLGLPLRCAVPDAGIALVADRRRAAGVARAGRTDQRAA